MKCRHIAADLCNLIPPSFRMDFAKSNRYLLWKSFMSRILLITLVAINLLLCPTTYATTVDLARELHIELNSADREIFPSQMAFQLMQQRPEYRMKEQEIKRVILEILDSKEYENMRVAYFSNAYDEQQLKEQLSLVRMPAFKLYQRKSMEMIQYSGITLMRLAQAKFSQLDNPSQKPDYQAASANRITFYSEDYGNFFISSWLYFDKESERLYHINFSNKIQGSEYSLFLFCAARKFSATHGFDRWAISADPVNEKNGMIGFLKKGESAESMLGAGFAKSQFVENDNKDISELCTKGEAQAKLNSQTPTPMSESTLRDQPSQLPAP